MPRGRSLVGIQCELERYNSILYFFKRALQKFPTGPEKGVGGV